jgi:hypothetical protein
LRRDRSAEDLDPSVNFKPRISFGNWLPPYVNDTVVFERLFRAALSATIRQHRFGSATWGVAPLPCRCASPPS